LVFRKRDISHKVSKFFILGDKKRSFGLRGGGLKTGGGLGYLSVCITRKWVKGRANFARGGEMDGILEARSQNGGTACLLQKSCNRKYLGTKLENGKEKYFNPNKGWKDRRMALCITQEKKSP